MSVKLVFQRCPANWNLQFVCDCRKKHQELKIYQAVAKRLSPYGSSVQSSHNVCSNKNILLRLEIPPLNNGDDPRMVEIIGRTVYTALDGEHFLTEIEFLRFEHGEQAMLAEALAQHFGHFPSKH